MEDLRELVIKAYNKDEDAMLNIIQIFGPLLKKLTVRSNNFVEESDLSLQVIYTVKLFNSKKLESFESNGQIFNYIERAVKNKYLQLSMKHSAIKDNEISLDESVIEHLTEQTDNFHETIYLDEILKRLTKLQRSVIIQKVINGRSDVEIAEELHISRQSVNRIKNRALKTLKNYI